MAFKLELELYTQYIEPTSILHTHIFICFHIIHPRFKEIPVPATIYSNITMTG